MNADARTSLRVEAETAIAKARRGAYMAGSVPVVIGLAALIGWTMTDPFPLYLIAVGWMVVGGVLGSAAVVTGLLRAREARQSLRELELPSATLLR